MKILMTGATGFVGSQLARELLDEGHTVHALARTPSKLDAMAHPQLKVFKGDLHDLDSIRQAAEGCEQAYHLAAYAEVYAPETSKFFEVNVRGTLNVVQACLDAGVKRLLYTSTAGVIGPVAQRGAPPADEEHIRPVDYFHPYETSKLLAEERIRHFLGQGMEIVVANITRVYGPGDIDYKNGYTLLVLRYLRKGRVMIPGSGLEVNNLVHMDEVVGGLRSLMARGRDGERYLIGSENVSLRSLLDTAGKLEGRKGRVIGVPFWLVKFAARMDVWRAKIFGGKPQGTPQFLRRYAWDWPFSVEKAREETGYAPIGMEEGLRRTIDWLKREGHLK